MPTSTGALIILASFAVYLGFRLERLNEIWPELETYEAKIEGEFLEFLGDEYISPFMEIILPKGDINEHVDNFPIDDDSISEMVEQNQRLEDEGVPENERKEILKQLFQEQIDINSLSDFNLDEMTFGFPRDAIFDQMVEMVMFVPSESKSEQIPDNIVDTSEDRGSDGKEGGFSEVGSSIFSYFIFDEDLLEPSQFFSETRSYYRKYRWPNRLFSLIQASMLALIVSIGVLLLFNFINSPVPDKFPIFIVTIGLMWLFLELILWYILSTEVEMETRTNVGKFLKPDPRELF